jgi:tetratricopeptide (TPR) repeat protein
VEGGKCN